MKKEIARCAKCSHLSYKEDCKKVERLDLTLNALETDTTKADLHYCKQHKPVYDYIETTNTISGYGTRGYGDRYYIDRVEVDRYGEIWETRDQRERAEMWRAIFWWTITIEILSIILYILI